MLPIVTLHFDGACIPINPGGTATAGWIIRAGNEIVALGYAVLCEGPKATNNYAEYCACGKGLRTILDLKLQIDELRIFGDSQLVVNQLNGTWRCKDARMFDLAAACHERLEGIAARKWRATWIPREQNQLCDDLSKNAYETRHQFNSYTKINGVEAWEAIK